MEYLITAVAFIAELVGLLAILIPHFKKQKKNMDKLAEGVKCQLRSDMLCIYYRNREAKKIRQYEYENFIMLYEAYKALGGNSFIDKIYNEVKKWEILT